ncbi:hemicentin-1 [Galendromus occidentalis]|uniref:Hemicentin-1 n=1 Tax=Galendromus occidentalis TaxID=34638 RepID=A0AAJ7SFB9_9ACAR|nr:hemicentin-1 [Galendromus occidentalis]
MGYPDAGYGSSVELNQRAPRFMAEPPSRVHFINNAGALIHCGSVAAIPSPTVQWVTSNDGQPVTTVHGLRTTFPNGTLYLQPFAANRYRQDVHATTYRCIATNAVGTAGSRDVRVRAVVQQRYEVQVYDEFVISGNTAVLRCHIPSYVRDYVSVVTWEREDGVTITSNVAVVTILEVGQRVSLPCDIESLQDDSPLRIRWFKDGQDAPNYIAEDVLKRGIWNGHHDISVAWAGRAFFSVLSDPAKLELSKLHVTDSGTYVCSVQFHRGDHKNTTSKIIVGVPPSVPMIRGTDGSVIRDKIGPLIEFSNLTLTCVIEKGSPAPTIVWKKNGQIIAPDKVRSNSTNEEGAISVLHFGPVKRRDLLHTFTCEADNVLMKTPAMQRQPKRSVSVVLDLTLPPQSVTIETNTEPLNADTSVEFRCRVQGSRPTPSLRWELEGWNSSKLESFSFIESADNGDGNSTSSVLVLPLRTEDNHKNITCVATNPLLPNSTWSQAMQLSIHHLPVVRLSLGNRLQEKHIIEGSDVYFECKVLSHPPASEVYWSVDGRELRTNASAGVVADEGFLVIRNISHRLSGIYLCTAINQRGPASSNVINLSVKYAPRCRNPETKSLVFSSIERAIDVLCDTDASPSENVHFSWSVKNVSATQPKPLKDFVVNGSASVLHYRPTTYVEHSMISCWANNSIGGMVGEPCTFRVEPKGVPPPLTRCVVSNQVGLNSWFHIQCADERPEAAGESYLLQLFMAESRNLLLNQTSPVPSFHINNIPEGAECIAEVSAVNDQGRGDPLRLTIQNIPPPSRLLTSNAPERGMRWPLSAIGSLCSVVVVVTRLGKAW